MEPWSTPRENVGVYGINQGDLALNSGNYDLSYQGNNLTLLMAEPVVDAFLFHQPADGTGRHLLLVPP